MCFVLGVAMPPGLLQPSLPQAPCLCLGARGAGLGLGQTSAPLVLKGGGLTPGRLLLPSQAAPPAAPPAVTDVLEGAVCNES